MKYVIDKDNSNKRLVYYNVNINGLDVNPINKVKNQSIKFGNVVLVDGDLQGSFIKQRINKKIDRIIKFMLRILNDDESSEEDTGMVLDELNRLKGIIINKYRKYMKESEYKSLLTKLILIEEEFKKSYNEKVFYSFAGRNYYEEEVVSMGGR